MDTLAKCRVPVNDTRSLAPHSRHSGLVPQREKMSWDEEMLGTIGLHNLRINCIVGIYPAERDTPQPVFIDVEIETDFAAASQSQAIGDTIDYNGIAQLLRDLANRRRFLLLEAFAEEGAATLLKKFSDIQKVRLEIRKPGAVAGAAAAFVRVERQRG